MKSLTEERLRVLVVGESALTRAGLEAALTETPNLEVVGSCDVAHSTAMMESTSADLVVLETASFRAWAPADDSTSTPPTIPLTPREIEVIRMLAEGASNKTIAWKLNISEHTAKFHVASILSKLGVGSRAEAVAAGVRLGLIYV